jgi:hypothetical protein
LAPGPYRSVLPFQLASLQTATARSVGTTSPRPFYSDSSLQL